jgi:GntR family transcriptional regulator
MEHTLEAQEAEATMVVRHEQGLHARPAAMFVKAASSFASKITVWRDDKQADAKSILGVLSLGVYQGTAIRLHASGPDADDAVLALKAMVESNFREAKDGGAPDKPNDLRRAKALECVHIDSAAIIPHYQQIQDELLAAIDSGELARGDPLPSEREFAEALGISRMTVRRALKDLQARGWLVSQVGKGWFVSPGKIEQRLSRLSGFSADMTSMNLKVHSRVLSFEAHPASGSLAERMAIAIGTRIYRLERVRLVNGEPLGIEEAHLRAEFCPDLLRFDFTRDSLYRVLREECGLELSVAEQTVEASIADWREASLLEIDPGAPVLRGSRVVRNTAGQVVEASRAVYRGDRYKYRIRISGHTEAEGRVK